MGLLAESLKTAIQSICRGGEAIIRVFGEPSRRGPPGPPRSAPRPHARPCAWVELGCQQVSLFGKDRDWVRVGRREGRFKAIRLHARGADVELLRVTVIYGNGEPDDLPTRHFLRQGSYTPPLDLKGWQRPIDRVDMVYKTVPQLQRPGHRVRRRLAVSRGHRITVSARAAARRPSSRLGRHERRVSAPLTFHSGVGLRLRYAHTKLEAFHMNIKACVFALALALVPAAAFAQSAPQTAAPSAAPQRQPRRRSKRRARPAPSTCRSSAPTSSAPRAPCAVASRPTKRSCLTGARRPGPSAPPPGRRTRAEPAKLTGTV